MIDASGDLFAARKIGGLPRDQRPRCGARTRAGGSCKAQALLNKAGEPGRCRMHGGLSTGPRSKKGKAAIADRAREAMRKRWVGYRVHNGGRVPLTEEGREKLRQTARRTMRLRHRKRQALVWADWLTRVSQNSRLRLFADLRRETLLRPFLAAAENGGLEELQELAALAGIDLRNLPDGAEITDIILARYAPDFDHRQLAADLRGGAS